MASSKRSSSSNHKEKIIRRKEEQPVEPELPKYRDRAKERREDQNPDYEASELGSFHAVAPPRTVDLLSGDVDHTHLVNKARSEIDKKPDAGDDDDGKSSTQGRPASVILYCNCKVSLSMDSEVSNSGQVK